MSNLQGGKIDVIVALDARGFLLGPIIASRLKAAFVPVRKIGKLPGECVSAEYAKEYGKVKSFFEWFGLIWSSILVLIGDFSAGCIRDASWKYSARPERRSY